MVLHTVPLVCFSVQASEVTRRHYAYAAVNCTSQAMSQGTGRKHNQPPPSCALMSLFCSLHGTQIFRMLMSSRDHFLPPLSQSAVLHHLDHKSQRGCFSGVYHSSIFLVTEKCLIKQFYHCPRITKYIHIK